MNQSIGRDIEELSLLKIQGKQEINQKTPKRSNSDDNQKKHTKNTKIYEDSNNRSDSKNLDKEEIVRNSFLSLL